MGESNAPDGGELVLVCVRKADGSSVIALPASEDVSGLLAYYEGSYAEEFVSSARLARVVAERDEAQQIAEDVVAFLHERLGLEPDQEDPNLWWQPSSGAPGDEADEAGSTRTVLDRLLDDLVATWGKVGDVEAERDEARQDSEEIKAIDEVLDDHLVPQLDESQTPVGGALRVELLVRERDMAREDYSAWKAQADDYGRDLAEERARADRYRETLKRADAMLSGYALTGVTADRKHEARLIITAALAEGEQPAGEPRNPWLDTVVCDHLLSTGETCEQCAPSTTETATGVDTATEERPEDTARRFAERLSVVEPELAIYRTAGHPVPTIDCVTTCEDGDVGFVPLRRDTVSSAKATAMMIAAAERWDAPLCPTCLEPPQLYAGREDPECDERVIVLDQDDPAVEFRQWMFADLPRRGECDCPAAPATPEGPDDA